MAKLTTKQRAALPKSEFALPGGRYPIPDKNHAVNAKARATQQVGKSITASQKATIDAKANKVLGGPNSGFSHEPDKHVPGTRGFAKK